MIHRKDSEQQNKPTVWSRLAERKDEWGYVEDFRERLDDVVPGEWDATYELLRTENAPDGTEGRVASLVTFKCRVQILGVIREGVATSVSPESAAEYAFLDACAMFGMGRVTVPE